MMRTFTAVKVPPTPELRHVLSVLGDWNGVRPVAPDSLHITLKFLGDTDERLLPGIQEAIAQTAGCWTACELRLRGLGAFPSASRATVVWVGLENAEPLIELTGELETALVRLGIARDPRAFQAHLTVARVKPRPPRELATYLQEQATVEFGACWLREVEFLRSELLPAGPRYSLLAAAPLRGSGSEENERAHL